MPISPENKHRYPADWPWIRQRVKEEAGYLCEFCGVPDRAWGYIDKHGYFQMALPLIPQSPRPASLRLINALGEEVKISQVLLGVAHLDHNPANNTDENLRALCQRCHLKHDRPHHAKTRYGAKPGQLLLEIAS